jgi:adenylate cyclase
MASIRLRGRVGPDGTLSFQLPESYAGAEAEVTVQERASVKAPPPIVARRASDMRLRRQQDALVTVARSPVLHSGDVPAAMRLITETLARALEVERASVWTHSPDRSRLHCEDAYAFSRREHTSGAALDAAKAPAFFDALDNAEIVTVANAYTDARVRDILTSHLRPEGVTAMLAAPIRLGGQTVGVLRADHAGAPRLWHLEDQNFAGFMAYTASLAMETGARIRAQAALERERETAERLLLNILPAPVAERLKRDASAIADSYDDVTVLFADVVDFTRLAASIPPRGLVDVLNEVFSSFDWLADVHGVEKIKTIGDNYMAVCGLPNPRPDHATAMVEMALDMRDEFARFCERTGHALSLRIGLHSGPVVAGVIGIKRFIYDLWGETVNTASRMESHGIAGRIQVSEATRQRVQGDYVWEDRGRIEVKGMGPLRTYLLDGRGPRHERSVQR